ncbi:MAG: diphthine synthase, partial [Candidatus Diapherotrites archaeon]
MLYLVGIGLAPKHITKESISALKSCEKIYLDSFTSQLPEGYISKLSSEVGKEIIALERKEIEENFLEKFLLPFNYNVALAVPGSPLNATTHIQLAIECKKLSIPVKIIPGISVFEFVAFTGLDRYKFGRTTTIVFHEPDYEPESFYDVIIKNKSLGLHT